MKTIQVAMLLVAASGGLAACSSAPVVQDRISWPGIPSALTQDCNVSPPPAIESYVAAPWSGPNGKEDQLTKYGRQETANLSACNKRLAQLRDYDTQMNKLYGVAAPSAASAPGASGSQ